MKMSVVVWCLSLWLMCLCLILYDLTSPVRTKYGMFVICCIQCCIYVSAVLLCVDVVSRGGI